MKITERNILEFKADFEKAVKDLEKKYDVGIKLGRITYDQQHFKGSLKVVNLNGGSDVNKIEWDRVCGKFGFKPTDYKRKVTIFNKSYTIEGIKVSSWKYPIILGRDGKLFKFPAHNVIEALN